jgi:hypothetical protein
LMVYLCSTTQAISADLWHCESGRTSLDVKKDRISSFSCLKKFSSAISCLHLDWYFEPGNGI